MSDVKFLQGRWGSGKLPRPVRADKNDAIEAIVSTGESDLVYFTAWDVCITSLCGTGDHQCEEFDGDLSDIDADQLLFYGDGYESDSEHLYSTLTDCAKKFKNRKYVIYSYKKDHTEYMSKWTMKTIMVLFNAFINRRRKVSVLCGIKGNFDLAEETCTLDDLLALGKLSAVTITDDIDTHVAVVNSYNGTTCISSASLARKPQLIDEYLKKNANGKRIYVFSTQNGCLAPRVHAPHLRLASTIITQVQAEEYADECPDNVTYDDNGISGGIVPDD